MTATVERATALDPKSLVPEEIFDLLVEDIRRYHHVTREYAARMMGQALVFLKAQGDIIKAAEEDRSKWVRIVPTIPVDPAWHAFMLRSIPYVEFCNKVAGRYLHHVPVMDEDIRSGAALARTLPLIHATGYRVDMEFWDDEAESCCPPDCSPPAPTFIA